MPRGIPNNKPKVDPAPSANEPAPMIMVLPQADGSLRFNAYEMEHREAVDAMRRALLHLVATANGAKVIDLTVPAHAGQRTRCSCAGSMEADMEERIEYQVLAPDSVAWHIQAPLTADRSGNSHARDRALAEAQRIAQERQLVAMNGEAAPLYDCRTTSDEIDDLWSELKLWRHCIQAQQGRIDLLVNTLTNTNGRLAALEVVANAESMWWTDMEKRLAELETLPLRVSATERSISNHSNRLAALEAWQIVMLQPDYPPGAPLPEKP